MDTFKILGLMLTYPEGSLLAAADEIVARLKAENLLPSKAVKRLEDFMNKQSSRDLFEVQEEYVEAFDRGRSLSLHLFEHIHGESRDRGQAMVDLVDTYATKGLYIDSRELPDYLPLFMEFLSRCEFEEASTLLGDAIDIVAAIGERAKKRKLPYGDVFDAIVALSAVKPDSARVKEALKNAPKDPQNLEELDEEWKEAEAFSGDPLQDAAANCATCPTLTNSTNAVEKMMGGLS